MAQAQVHIGKGPASRRAPALQSRSSAAKAPPVRVFAACEACNDSGEVWLLDRHAGAVWMPCGCGAARERGASASWLAIVVYPCVAAGLCASMFFLL